MVFAARQLQEKSMEQHQDLYMTFVDLTKAFNTVSSNHCEPLMADVFLIDRNNSVESVNDIKASGILYTITNKGH